jgi:hypothetical protein
VQAGNTMDAEIEKALAYAQKLIDTSLAVVGAARVDLNENFARDPKVVAPTILCRSISNFRAAIRLAQQEQVLEGRAIVRMMYENLLWMGALRERGLAFVQDMVQDHAYNSAALAEATLKLTAKAGADVSGPDALTLRNIIKEFDKQFPRRKKLSADKTAAQGQVETAYIEYGRLSLDAVHCSIVALGRHLSSERTDDKVELTVNVIPRTPPNEVLSTILHTCRALMRVAVGANELVGFTSVSRGLRKW